MRPHYLTATLFCLLTVLVGCQSGPQPGDLYLRDAHMARDADQRTEAKTLATLAIEDGRREGEARELLALIHREEAREAEAAEEHQEAYDAYRKAANVELNPSRRSRDLHGALRAADHLHLSPSALSELLLLTLELDTQNLDLHRRVAFIADEQGDLELAAYHYLWVVAADSTDQRSTLRLGMTYLSMERHREAAAMLRRVVDAQPDNVPAAMNLIAALTPLNRVAEIREIFQDLQQRFPAQPMILRRFADFEEAQGYPGRAARLRQQATEAAPAIEEREEMRPLR